MINFDKSSYIVKRKSCILACFDFPHHHRSIEGLCLLPAMFSFTWVGRNRRRCGEAATPSQATQQRSFCLSEIGKNESWWSLFFQKAYVLVEDFEIRGAIKSKEVKNERAKRWVIAVHSWRFSDMSGSKRVDMRKQGTNGDSKVPLLHLFYYFAILLFSSGRKFWPNA